MVRLTDVAHLSMGSAPGSIDRFNRMGNPSPMNTPPFTTGRSVTELSENATNSGVWECSTAITSGLAL